MEFWDKDYRNIHLFFGDDINHVTDTDIELKNAWRENRQAFVCMQLDTTVLSE